MNSKNKPAMTADEREHVARLKSLRWCACCEQPCEPEVHEIEQGDWFTAIPLDVDCHRGHLNGLHGQRRAWTVRKLTDLGALNRTVRRLMGAA